MVPEGWKHQEIGDWLVEFRTKSAVQDEHPVMTSSRNGIVLQSDYYGDGRITQRENIGFHVLPPGFITYRSRSDDGLFFFNMNALGTTGLVSHFYPVFHFPAGSTGFFLDLLNTYREVFSAHAVGSSQVVLSLNALKKVRLPIPPAREQQKIAEILGTWDKAIETTEALLANARTQKRALMQSLLTGTRRFPGFEDHPWREVRLGDVAEVAMGSSPKSEAYNSNGIGLPLIQGNADIKDGRSSPRSFTSEITQTCKPGDILMSVRAPVGTVAVSDHEACVGRGAAVIGPRTGTDWNWLFQQMKFLEDKWARVSQGSTFDAVNGKEIRDMPVHCPKSLDEQRRIGDVLRGCDVEDASLSAQLNHLRTEKKSLMQQLLTGKRRVVV